jgi:energy-coupling factor transport system ATP-binding protein
VLLLAPSGGGKSTLLAALAGLHDPESSGRSEGTLLVDGRHPRDVRARTGLVLQDPEAQVVMARAGDDVAFGLENRGVPRELIWSTVDAALEAVRFPYGRDRSTTALSGGEKQRLALAGALALRPGLLLLDEPTAQLDPAGARLVRDVVAGVRDTTLLLVEHRVAEALPLVDRVVVLDPGGGLLADGPPEVVFAQHGRALADRGVWVPGLVVPPRRAAQPAGPTVLTAAGLRHPRVRRPLPDLHVCAGEAVALTGANGVGKSTCARMLGGLVEPAGGCLQPPLHRWRARTLAGFVGSVFQEPEHQFLARTVAEELELGPLRLGSPPAVARERREELLARLHLERLADANPFTLSGGEQRRLSVGTALATRPQLLVLDEPTFGQDARTWRELLDLLAGLRDDGAAVLAVTHDEAFAGALADRTLVLQ